MGGRADRPGDQDPGPHPHVRGISAGGGGAHVVRGLNGEDDD